MQEHHQQHGQVFPRGRGNVLILNPRYVDDSTPRYAAFRLNRRLNEDEQDSLLRRVSTLKDSGLKSNTTDAHGPSFHQWWFGYWHRYGSSTITGAETSARGHRTAAITDLIRELNSSLGRTATALRKLDRPTSIRMRYNHRNVARHARHVATDQPDRPMARLLARQRQRENNAAFRIGGMGTMLAISSGEGTAYHYDKDDDNAHYSLVYVLGRGGILRLPELGYDLEVRPGDVLGFLANQQYHKLETAPADTPAPEQIVLTLWSCALANKKAKDADVFHEYRSFWQSTKDGDVVNNTENHGTSSDSHDPDSDEGNYEDLPFVPQLPIIQSTNVNGRRSPRVLRSQKVYQ